MAPNLSLSLRDAVPPNARFLGSIGVHNPNDISIGSAVFVGLTVVTNTQTDRQTQRHTETTHHATRVTIQEVIRYEKLFQHALIADIKPAQSNARNQTKKVEKRKKNKK